MLKKVYITSSTSTSLECSIISGDYKPTPTDPTLIKNAKATAKNILANNRHHTTRKKK
ncbi:MAG: hypothetical protein ACOC56_03895 [Atribacterota bacterium]